MKYTVYGACESISSNQLGSCINCILLVEVTHNAENIKIEILCRPED